MFKIGWRAIHIILAGDMTFTGIRSVTSVLNPTSYQSLNMNPEFSLPFEIVAFSTNVSLCCICSYWYSTNPRSKILGLRVCLKRDL